MSDPPPKYGHGHTFHVHLRDLIDGASGVLRELLSGAKLSDESVRVVATCGFVVETIIAAHERMGEAKPPEVSAGIDALFAELRRMRDEIVAESPDIQRELSR